MSTWYRSRIAKPSIPYPGGGTLASPTSLSPRRHPDSAERSAQLSRVRTVVTSLVQLEGSGLTAQRREQFRRRGRCSPQAARRYCDRRAATSCAVSGTISWCRVFRHARRLQHVGNFLRGTQFEFGKYSVPRFIASSHTRPAALVRPGIQLFTLRYARLSHGDGRCTRYLSSRPNLGAIRTWPPPRVVRF